jgi:hypothetical protein
MSPPPLALTVVAPTFYSSLDEPRYLLGIEACRQAAKYRIRLILVDASPLEEVRKGLEEAGKANGQSFVQVVPQKQKGRKGVALREAINAAYEECGDSRGTHVIAFQELEKIDMFRHWHSLLQHMHDTASDITVPRRADGSFHTYYPIEQYHAESFANLYLDSLGGKIGLASVDWTMGPVAFRCSYTSHWLRYDGELWDAQLVPLVQAHLAGAKVSSYEVDYHHPETMKQQEQGVPIWNEKRLLQLNFLKDTVGKLMKEITPSAST